MSTQYDQWVATCEPTVRFRTVSGQQITFSPPGSSDYEVGNVLPVRYHPTTPQDARLVDLFSIWFPPLLLVGGSLICLIFCLGLFKNARKQPIVKRHAMGLESASDEAPEQRSYPRYERWKSLLRLFISITNGKPGGPWWQQLWYYP